VPEHPSRFETAVLCAAAVAQLTFGLVAIHHILPAVSHWTDRLVGIHS